MKKNQIVPAVIFTVIVLFILIKGVRDMNFKKANIQQNQITSIAKVTQFYSNRSFDTYTYQFYVNGRIYNNSEHINGHAREDCIGKYFKIKFSSINPNLSNLLLDEAVTDTKAIKEAGFN